ncbi:MAG TPA: ABC transporter permease [Bryobacteraceae bacterium]|nr:ABC transporter permease [Bryobacteraceae bacterium]
MLRDLQWALRALGRNPRFAAVIMAILALAIGANTAVFSVVDAVLLHPAPYRDPGRLVRIQERSTRQAISGVPAQDFLRLRERRDLFEQAAANIKDIVTVTGIGNPDQVVVQRVSASAFAMLGARARLGRTLVESDERTFPNAVVLTDRLWRRLFHADPNVLGRAIAAAPDVFTVVGVMPPEFEYPYSDVEMWVPLQVTPASKYLLQVTARTASGVSLVRAQSALAIVARQWEQEDPHNRAGLQIEVTPWREETGRQYELTLVFILGAVGLVLLIACADVGSLLLSRAVQRQRELAIRASLGAGFWRVVRQLLCESLVLAVAGSAAGVLLAHYLLGFLLKQVAALPALVAVLPHVRAAGLNGRALVFNAVLCLVISCLCSLGPVVLASRTDLQAVLRGSPAAGGKRGSARVFSILIASEAAFAFLLLVGSGLMIRSLIRLQQADHGFHADHVLTLRVPVGNFRSQPSKYGNKPLQMAYYREMMDRLEKVPGIRAIAIVNNLPLSGANTTLEYTAPDNQIVMLAGRTISPQYFAAMGISLIAGRTFTDDDTANAPGVAIINQYLARQLFPGRDPLGQIMPGGGPPVTIVGVVRDAAQMSYEQPAKGEIYRPYQQYIFGVFLSTIVARTSGDPLALAGAIRQAVWDVDPNQPVLKVETMEDVVADSIWRPRFSAWVFTVLGGLALLLTSAGVYSVIAYTTALRAREMGIRVALGATPGQVMAIVFRDAMLPLAAGLALSVAAAFFLSRLLASLLYEIGSSDPVTYAGAGLLLLAIGAAASLRPARQAALADPLKALRAE